MNQSVLPQLQDIESNLAEQEESISAQLEEVREKLRGLRSVLPMFGEGGALTETADVTTTGAAEAVIADVAGAKVAKEVAVETSEEPEIAEKKVKVKKGKASKKKKDGRAASWQKYTRPGVKEKTIPEAVRFVLATQPDKSFKIAEVMDALFADMPKSQYLKARNRISNVLSGGVRDNEWYKGDRGTYRLSK